MTIVRAIDKLNKAVSIILAILLAVMTIVILLQVFSRFVFTLPIAWSEELGKYLMIYTTFLAAAVAFREGKLIGVTFLLEKLNGESLKRAQMIINLLSMVLFAVLFYQGIKMCGEVMMQSTYSLGVSMAVPYSAIPVGAFLLFINGIANLIETFSKKEGE